MQQWLADLGGLLKVSAPEKRRCLVLIGADMFRRSSWHPEYNWIINLFHTDPVVLANTATDQFWVHLIR